jgi:hypothetical protein
MGGEGQSRIASAELQIDKVDRLDRSKEDLEVKGNMFLIS